MATSMSRASVNVLDGCGVLVRAASKTCLYAASSDVFGIDGVCMSAKLANPGNVPSTVPRTVTVGGGTDAEDVASASLVVQLR